MIRTVKVGSGHPSTCYQMIPDSLSLEWLVVGSVCVHVGESRRLKMVCYSTVLVGTGSQITTVYI